MLEPGEQIDIWVVESALGSGGMGSVYRCHNRTASRILAAVKVLEGGVRRHPEAEARFVREAEILFQLDHPNIVKVRNIRTDADPPYLEMEFVEGESLESRLQRGALPYEECVSFMEQIASAVAYLHRKGIRHRDIKPANLLVKPDGRIKLVDFGLAMEANVSRLTQQGMTFGTVSYAPPEWISPETLDPARWDLYSVGVVFYEMLTGRVAFPVSGQGSVRQQAMQVIVGKQGHRALDPGDHFHADVRNLVRSMTQSDPSVRVADADAVHRLVRSLRGDLKREVGVTIMPPRPEEDEEYPSVVQELPSPDPLRTPDGLPSRFEGSTGGGAATWMASEVATEVGPPDRVETPMPPPSLLDASTAPALAPRQAAHGTLANERRLSVPTISLPPARLAAPLLFVVGSMGLAALVLVAGVAAVLMTANPSPELRAVDVVVTGVPHALQVGIKVGETPPRDSDGAVFSFRGVPLGEQEITWVMGAECPLTSCPGLDCPAWCGTGTVNATITEGVSPQIVTLALQTPPQRTVRVALPSLEPELGAVVTLGERPASLDESGGAVVGGVEPGVHALTVTLGECEEAAVGCWPDQTCPAGCVSYVGELVVGWGSTELVHDLSLPVPEKPKARARRPARPAPSAAAASSGGAAVTNREFAAWLRGNPDWLPQAAVAAGLANPEYLTGWEGAQPPPGREHHAVTHISWHAAAAYCRGRGGLASLSAPPERWTESDTQPWIEFRVQDGKAAWKASDGRTSTSLNLRSSNSTMGFRCAR